MITEADARALDYGSTVVLVAGGHVTPLALDTLRARRITVVRDGADPDAADLVPASAIRTVAIAGDHTSLALKSAIVRCPSASPSTTRLHRKATSVGWS